MSLEFYYLSGSPFAWKVWLALEHKRIPYTLRLMSVDAGDLKTPAYRAINPHGKVPAIVHDGFVLYESSAIVEYLEEAFPQSGPPLWPADPQLRAVGRRLAAEAEGFLYPPIRQVFEQLVLRQDGPPDEAVLAKARAIAGKKMALLAESLRGPFFLGDLPTLADYAVYPLTALLVRLGTRRPDLDLAGAIPPGLADWRTRMEALPYLDATWPPHWRG
ncbi:glutathione S-transferase family protein [Methylomagnum ishizawai]|uniref:glutathione S-transferase family protein n=1 Tax=Methylomagnum ishizawai TaxID=1760988 RepID=UPI001C333319|nr:glutathione S-transferase family protein [Methylomagnum ishizawai]BBL77114.1 maleylacetoacetate isomerase [Methylomagnum ishizawai]